MADYQDLIGLTIGKCRVLGIDRWVDYKYSYGIHRRPYYKCECLQCGKEFSRVRRDIKKGSPCRTCTLQEGSKRLSKRNVDVAASVRQKNADALVGAEYNGRTVVKFICFKKSGHWLVPFYLVRCLSCGFESEVGKPTVVSCGCLVCSHTKGKIAKDCDRGIDKRGYAWIKIPGHPMAEKNGRCFEHRLVMADHLGRNLLPSETVHHIKSWEKANNDISNLELWNKAHPAGSRVEDIVAFSKEMLALYEPGALAQQQDPNTTLHIVVSDS